MKMGMREPMRKNWICGMARKRVRIGKHQRIAAGEQHVADLRGALEVLESGLPLGFEMLFAHPGHHPRTRAIPAVRGTAVSHQEQHPVGIAVDQPGHRHVAVLATWIGVLLRRVPAFLDARDDLAADRTIRIIAVNQIEKMRGDGHRQLVAGQQHAGPLNVG